MKFLQDYQQTLIARHYNSNFSNETKEALSNIIEEIGEMIPPKVEWEKGISVDSVSTHDKSYMIFGYDQYGGYWEAVGHYSCGDLVEVENPEKQSL